MHRGRISAPPFMPPGGMRFPGAPPGMPPLPANMPHMPNAPQQPAPQQQNQPVQTQPAYAPQFPYGQQQPQYTPQQPGSYGGAPPDTYQQQQFALYQQLMAQQAQAQQAQAQYQQQQEQVMATLMPLLAQQLQTFQGAPAGGEPESVASNQHSQESNGQSPTSAPLHSPRYAGTYSTKGPGIQFSTRM